MTMPDSTPANAQEEALAIAEQIVARLAHCRRDHDYVICGTGEMDLWCEDFLQALAAWNRRRSAQADGDDLSALATLFLTISGYHPLGAAFAREQNDGAWKRALDAAGIIIREGWNRRIPAEGGLVWVRFGERKPRRGDSDDLCGEEHLLTWNVRVGTYDHACIDSGWSPGESIDGHSDDLWAWLPPCGPALAHPAPSVQEEAGTTGYARRAEIMTEIDRKIASGEMKVEPQSVPAAPAAPVPEGEEDWPFGIMSPQRLKELRHLVRTTDGAYAAIGSLSANDLHELLNGYRLAQPAPNVRGGEGDWPSDGTCVRCGACPRSPTTGLCATCEDEDREAAPLVSAPEGAKKVALDDLTNFVRQADKLPWPDFATGKFTVGTARAILASHAAQAERITGLEEAIDGCANTMAAMARKSETTTAERDALTSSLDDAKELLQQRAVYGYAVSQDEAIAALSAANGFDFDKEALRTLGVRIINLTAAEARWRSGLSPVYGDPQQPRSRPSRALSTLAQSAPSKEPEG